MSRIIKNQFASEDGNIVIKVHPIIEDHEQNDQEETGGHSHLEETIGKAKEQAKSLVNEAKKQADQLLEDANRHLFCVQEEIEKARKDWEQEHTHLVEQAKQEGYQIGYGKGLEEGHNEYINTIEQAKGVVHKAEKDYMTHIEDAESEIIQIALKVAHKIMGISLEEDHEKWLGVVKQGIREVKEQDNVKIHVHPTYYELTLHHQEELKAMCQPNVELYILPDSDLEELQCLIESPFGTIDASIDSQLLEVKRKLLEKLEENNHGSNNDNE